MSLLASVHAAVTSDLGDCVDHVCALTADATTLSEREVLSAGTRIATLGQEAKASLGTLDALSRHFGTGEVGGHASLEAAVQGQAVAMTAFLKALTDALVRQNEATTGIVEAARQIGTLVAGMEVLALNLGMLTINARIEAARWGSQGAAFATVAAGMRELTGEVQRVNVKVGDLAMTLSGLASRVVDNDKLMHDLGTTLDKEVPQRIRDLREAYASTQSSAASAVDLGNQLATRMVEFSSATLTNLQFQDRVAQTFREIDAIVGRSRTFAQTLLTLADAHGEATDVEAAIAEARERAGSGVVRISRESELSSSDRTMQSGVVELF